jgi:hypothetical protein
LNGGASIGRSSALQLWAIGVIAPLLTIAWNVFEGGLQTDWHTLWTAGNLALFGDVAPARGTEFPYPPYALFILTPFALLPYVPSYIAWNVVTGAFFLWAARPYLPKGMSPLLVLLTPGALMSIHLGQTGLLVGALWLLAFRGSWASVALLTFKPHLGVLSIFSIRSRSALVKMIALVLALAAVSVLLFGISAWRDFANYLLSHESQFTTRTRWHYGGVSPGFAYGIAGWLPFALAAGLILMRRVNAFTAATAALIVSPYGFNYDMPTASLGIGLAIWSHWNELGWGKRLGLALGFFVPTLASLGVWWMPPILLWALWVQVGLPEKTIKEGVVTE